MKNIANILLILILCAQRFTILRNLNFRELFNTYDMHSNCFIKTHDTGAGNYCMIRVIHLKNYRVDMMH